MSDLADKIITAVGYIGSAYIIVESILRSVQ